MKQILVFTLATLMSLVSIGQSNVSGRVVDGETNEALPGAVVSTEDGTGTTSDLDGFYSLKLKAGTYLLRASYVGMQPMSITVVVNSENQTIF
jgi:hypothetical protein